MKIRLLPRIEEAIIRSTGEWVSFPSIHSIVGSESYNSDFLGILEVKNDKHYNYKYFILSGPVRGCTVNKDHCYEVTLFEDDIKKILKI